MSAYLGIPVSIWGTFILPYLGIHDALSMKQTSKYSRQAFPHLLEHYSAFVTQCKDFSLSLPLYAQTKAELQRLSNLAYVEFSQNFDRRGINEVKSVRVPADCVRATMEVWATLLTGTRPRDPVQGFCQLNDYLTPLQSISQVPDRALLRSFLAAHNHQELQRCSTICGHFVKYLERMGLADDLVTQEYEKVEETLKHWQHEEAICMKIQSSQSTIKQ